MSRLHTAPGQELAELANRLADGPRLSRGRRYQRQGSVEELDVSPGLVHALVVGSRDEPYSVSIACKHANENERQAARRGPEGAVPRVIDVAFTCICPDWGDPCKHGVAAMLEFAQQVDHNASLLFEWRGMGDLVPPPPPGTESLEIHGPSGPTDHKRRTAEAVRDELDDVLVDASTLERSTSGEALSSVGENDHLAEFFRGAMPDEVDSLLGPLDETQLEAFAKVRIVVGQVDAAPVFADAIETIADHWLGQ